MQAGFALLEAGSVRMKNAGHVAGKTFLTFGISIVAFWALGFGLAFGNGNSFSDLKVFLSGDNAAGSFDSLSAYDVPTTIMFCSIYPLRPYPWPSLAVVWQNGQSSASISSLDCCSPS